MTDTHQLPEPELGYIKTDISNQPAFSARQMREAMEHALTQHNVSQDSEYVARFGRVTLSGPREDVEFAVRHLPDVDDEALPPQPAQATQSASAEDMKVYDSIADRYFIEAAPKDHQIAALVNKVRDIARMFHDHQSLRERIAIELVPALKASQEVKSNAERWLYAIADSGNQSMNFIDIFDDWDGDGDFVAVFDAARLADKDTK